MGLGLRFEVKYNAVIDQVFLTSVSPDWDTPVVFKPVHGSEQDVKLRELLEEEGIYNPATQKDAVKLPGAETAGMFGVYSNGKKAHASVENTGSMFVVGKEGSGVANLVRNYLLWALENEVKVLTVNAPNNVYGMADEFEEGQLKNIASDNLISIMEGERFKSSVASDEKLLVIIKAEGDIEDTPKYWQQFQKNLFSQQTTQQVFLVVSDQLLDEEGGAGSGYYWASDEVFGAAIIGDVNQETVEFLFPENSVPSSNPRGVLWLNTFILERIHTYLIPKDFTQLNS